jgi:AcrR family transcriptional regulator
MPRNIRTYSRNEQLVQARRALIIENALRLFLEKGYDRTTVRELAKSCGMTEGAIYRYIGSKNDILHLLLLDTKVNFIEDFLKGLGDVNTTDALKGCINVYYTWCNDAADRNMFYNREIINFSAADRRTLLKSQADYIQFFEKLIKRGVSEGVFKVKDPLLIAHNIVMQGFDWGLRRWFLRSFFTLDRYIELQLELIFDLLHVDSKTQEDNYLTEVQRII